ncbi:CubicO group peptidase, beta-lactamase class C family [Algoriphagus locisalis]|uniref:CubicO group peptidase, beta-lactamase class C family n=1 Tax=Algoriphagus locisalis TaxID=305507 RepID=A0A1I6Z0A5_9BACT|nr:serine hydrolase domain-containing protein [Algoriphagus locisalis]SFT56157.1 CubicO group peptidase, beta-lactamase class C family [Algoriphagus locisalis]
MKKLFLYACAIAIFSSSCDKKQTEDSTETLLVNDQVRARIDSTLSSFVESGNLAGVSALIFEKDQEVYYNAFGYADRENQVKMDRNTIVQIYSMTKPITGTALMTLYEEGKFQLDDPLSKYAPEFAEMKVYDGVDENGEIKLVDAERPVTIRDITRHTAGFPNRADIPGLSELLAEKDPRSFEIDLNEMAKRIGEVPLWFQPGTQWEYGQSVDVQAFLVERIAGIPYKEYVQTHVLDPLKMSETRYFVPESDRARMSASYRRTGEGQLEQLPNEEAHRFNINEWPLTPGGFGFTSTLDDYMTFARMLVNKGEFDGVRVLKPETVELMSTNQLPDSVTERSWLPSKGNVGFGIDFAVRVAQPTSAEEVNGIVGEFFWDGAASTLFWVDPVNEITAVLFVQLYPYDQIKLHKKFKDAVYGKYQPAVSKN